MLSRRVHIDMSIGLLVADDHEPTRDGLRAMFASTDIEVVGEATTPEETRRLVANTASVEVLLLEVAWRGRAINDGVGLLSEVLSLRAQLPILIYSVYSWSKIINTCRRFGADGYLVKGTHDQWLPDAVWAVYGGGSFWG